MVKIIYYADPTKESETFECETVADFLLPRFKTRDELLDLRFFDGDLLSHEIDQINGDFLDINEGVVAITHDSMIPRDPFTWYVVIAVTFAVLTIVLMPSIPKMGGGRDQQSGTNALGDSTNEPRINERIDDIFGTVNKHVPSLWQVPYKIGVNNQEAEVLLCCVGRGKYDINPDNWYDGDTPVKNIPNASVNIYGPGKNPSVSEPDLIIGNEITEKIGIYRQSNDLNPSELLPPNARENAGIKWRLSGSGGSAVLNADFMPDGFDFQEFYNVGDTVNLSDVYYLSSNGTIDLYRSNTIEQSSLIASNPSSIAASNTSQDISISIPAGAIEVTDGTNTYSNTNPVDGSGSNSITVNIDSESIVITGDTQDTRTGVRFQNYNQPVDLGGEGNIDYVITAVTSNSITLSIPADAPLTVVNAWSAMSNYYPPSFYAEVNNLDLGSYYVTDNTIQTGDWFFYQSETVYPVTVNSEVLNPITGAPFDNRIGPLFIPDNTDEIIINLVSNNGFYKLDENSEVAITANVIVKIYELDVNGNETGNVTSEFHTYSSNGDSVTQSVFKTLRLVIPYDRCKITAERTSFRDKRKEVSNVDKIEWRDLYTFESVNVTDFGDVTLAHVYTPSNSQSRLIKQRKQNVDLTRLITQYLGNGSFGPAESYATNNASQIIVHTALDPYIGRLSLSNINADGFLDISNEITNYFGSSIMNSFGYVFDTTKLTYQDTFAIICDAIMCTPYAQNGIYDAFFERKQTISSMQITCRNKIVGSETRKTDYHRKYDGVELNYRDNDTGVSETIYVPSDQSSRNPERKDLSGCTTKLQALRYANRMYNRQLYEIEYTKFDVDEFGRNIIPNKRIDSPDSTRFTKREGVTDGYRVYDGEVVEINGMQVELSEPVEFTAGEDHYITFTKDNGDSSQAILCTQVDEFTVSLSTMPSEPIYDGYDKDRTKFMLVSEQLAESVALIPKTIEYNLSDDGDEIHTVSSVNYTDKYYQNDLDELE